MITRRAAVAGLATVSTLGPSLGARGAQEVPAAHVFNLLPIKSNAMAAFLPVMQANAKASRLEVGNISFDVFQEESGGNSLLLFESWKSRDAHNHHMTLPHLKAVEQKAATDFGGEPVTVWVTDIAGLPGHQRKAIANAGTTRNVIVRLRVKPDARATFIQAFGEVIPQARSAPGNHVFDLYQEVDVRDAFVVFERWQDTASHESHLGQPYSKKLDGILPGALQGKPERYLLRDVAV